MNIGNVDCRPRSNEYPEPFRRELGVIGHFFMWEELDQVWLLEQLLIMLRAGFAPADSFGVLDNLAELVPEHIEKVIDATNGLVRRPSVEAWTFAAQEQSLRKILIEGMKTRPNQYSRRSERS